jgi:hypothetical protein
MRRGEGYDDRYLVFFEYMLFFLEEVVLKGREGVRWGKLVSTNYSANLETYDARPLKMGESKAVMSLDGHHYHYSPPNHANTAHYALQ